MRFLLRLSCLAGFIILSYSAVYIGGESVSSLSEFILIGLSFFCGVERIISGCCVERGVVVAGSEELGQLTCKDTETRLSGILTPSKTVNLAGF